MSKRLFASTVGQIEEKSAFKNLFFIIFVHLIQLFSSVENFGGGVLEIAFFLLKTRETFFEKKDFFSIIFGHWARVSQPSGKFSTGGVSKPHSEGPEEHFGKNIYF